ncbi:hypothetical protein [Natronomonas sp. EA1]|uniref:hypothetical protein n=1 Tax=Natronomonas sp. EA1 TaxID=3421655 RepID=UPI003EC02978
MDLSLLVAAAALGITHAAEPDHVAGIISLGSEGGRKRAALVGASFAAGHVLLVLAWLTVATVLAARLPLDRLDAVGGSVLGGCLLLVSLFVARSGVRTLRGERGHDHGATRGARHLPHAEGTRGLLVVSVTGALFTLSPPVSMLAFVTGVLSTGAALAVVAAYAVAITGGMVAVGLLAGVAFERLDGRTLGGAQLVAAAVTAFVALSVLA